MDRHTLNILEFGKVIESVAGTCLTVLGHEVVTRLQPQTEHDRIVRQLDEMREMVTVLETEGDFPLGRVADIREPLLRSLLEGTFLDPKELLAIAEFLEMCQGLMKFSKISQEKYPLLEEHLSRLVSGFELVKRIRTAIDEDGEVRDNASRELHQLRGEKRAVRDSIIARLQQILAKKDPDPAWQEDVITLRNDRFVIPVRAGDLSPRDGVIQDRSSTGQTLFVEPFKVIELNNRLRQVLIDERQEVERILRSITRMVAGEADHLGENIRAVGILDSLYARARWAKRTESCIPELVDRPQFHIIKGRHPLLVIKALEAAPDLREEVVPISVELGESFTALVVTGPNTGGKTVSLKTVGLLTLMAQSGLPVPAAAGTKMGIFGAVFADIGDEQSIESSLSTFSSHVRRIRNAVEGADERSLVLLDELGAGTDPREGAALGEAIITSLTEKGARVMCTTHYTALKALSQNNPLIENAAVEFNKETLQPTYRLHLGVPGASYAIDIARRLGMPQTITEKAASLLGDQELNLTRLLAELEDTLARVRKQEEELSQRLSATGELDRELQERKTRLQDAERDFQKKALAESEKIIAETKGEIERLVKEIRETQAHKDVVKKTHQYLAQKAQETKVKIAALQDPPAPKPQTVEGPLHKGDRVWVEPFNKEGEVADIFSDQQKVKLRLGNMFYTIDEAHCRKLQSATPPRREVRPAPISYEVTSNVGPEISLRGLTGEEAREALDRYLDEALLAGWEEIRIVHGKGTGVLRQVVTDMVKTDKRIVSHRIGEWNEGDLGVTIARLKK
jgi:DNA mismatch repair protein MutS2